MNKKRVISILLSIVMFISYAISPLPTIEVEAATAYEQSLLNAGFPQSYVTKLSALHKLHPNWKFEPLLVTKQKPAYTWKYVIGKETESNQRNLIYHTYSAEKYALDSVLVESGLWYKCNKATVEFFMDPRNFLDEERIFQFKDLKYTNDCTVAAVENSLAGTFMQGVKLENGKTYAQNLYDIGKSIGVNPFHLAARIKQEQGIGQSPLISGACGTKLAECYTKKTNGAPATGYNGFNFAQYNGLYNYFNMGAFGTGYFEIWLNGMKEAQTGGWNTRYKAIQGGAKKDADTYINQYQNTLYLQKFNVHPSSSKNFWGQYMQNVSAAWSESITIYNAYKNGGILDNTLTFLIPVYDGMPASCKDPGGAFLKNTGASLNVIPASLKSQVFDAEYYANAHSDLKSAYGTDETKLYSHFINNGIKEGRQAHPAFNVAYYTNNNSDLKSAFGKDYEKAMNHFVTIGYSENRTTAKTSNLGSSFYAKITSAKSGKNVTLKDSNVIINENAETAEQVWRFELQSDGSYQIFSTKDITKVIQVNGGKSESGTNVCVGDDADTAAQCWYIYANGSNYILKSKCANLRAMDCQDGGTANGTNIQIYTVDGTPAQDFIITETEVPSVDTEQEQETVTIPSEKVKLVFDATYYANAHPDLKKAFGSDSTKLYEHFLVHGIKEGRQAHPIFDVKYYLSQNKDLQEAFGKDYEKVLNHYITIGYKENRKTAQVCDLGTNFYAKISPAAATNMNMTLSSSKVVISDPSSSNAQIWKFVRYSDGSYKIVNMKSGTKVLDGTTNSKKQVKVADGKDLKSQRWFIFEKNNTYILKRADSQYSVLDLSGNKTADNTNVIYSTVDGAKTQRWKITQTSEPATNTNTNTNTGTTTVTYKVTSPYNTNSIGTYTSLDLAKSAAAAKVQYGYVVYDSKGKCVYTPATSLNASKILWEAKIVADYIRDNSFKYGNATKNPYYDKSEKLVSCDRFVGWTLGNAGYIKGQPSKAGLNLYGIYNDMGEACLETVMKQNGFTKITSESQVRAGDIVFVGYSTAHTILSAEMRQYPQHVYIAASNYSGGQAYRYDAGSNARIRSTQPTYEPISYSANLFRFAYRAPSTGNNIQTGSVTTSSSGTKGEAGVTISSFQKTLVFDATYYSSAYPDLKNAFGTDAVKLYKHFLNYGIKEGRQAHPVFDVKYYLSQNSDLQKAFGKDYSKVLNHYIKTGYKENRKTAKPANLGTDFYAKISSAAVSNQNLSFSNGKAVIATANTSASQVWKFERVSNGSYKLINAKSGTKYLDCSDNANQYVTIANADNSKEQRWFFYEKNGAYVIKCADSQYSVLDLKDNKTAAGTNVVYSGVDAAKTQSWKVTKTNAPSSNGKVEESTTITYRVASPDNTNCIGTYSSLSSAKSVANSKVQLGYVVYDSKGKLAYTPATSLTASRILWEAKKVADYQKANNWTYGDAKKNPYYDKSEKIVSCDRFVGWVLGNAGFISGQPATRGLPLPGHNLDLQYNSLESFLKLHGFTKITNIAEVKAGDIVFVGYCYNHTYLAQQYRSYASHVFIAASNYGADGQTYRYDDGSTARIRSTQPFYEPLNYASNPFRFAYRAPANGGTGYSGTTTKVSISSSQKSLVFDATYYSNKYPDLKAAYGTDATKLYNHFLNHGIYEGRQGCAAFNAKTYLSKYSDLKSAFGNDYAKAINHYLTYGYNEGRRAPA